MLALPSCAAVATPDHPDRHRRHQQHHRQRAIAISPLSLIRAKSHLRVRLPGISSRARYTRKKFGNRSRDAFSRPNRRRRQSVTRESRRMGAEVHPRQGAYDSPGLRDNFTLAPLLSLFASLPRSCQNSSGARDSPVRIPCKPLRGRRRDDDDDIFVPAVWRRAAKFERN